MINYTERLTWLMSDIIAKVPALSYIDMSRVIVFARFGRSEADGAYATCHSLNLPSSEPGYYFWRDRRTGKMTRRSEWFVTKSPAVQIDGAHIDYLISFCLPRFCDQTIKKSRKQIHYPNAEPWIAKLDTVIHELYHIDPEYPGIRRLRRADGQPSSLAHSPAFFTQVADMAQQYLAARPSPAVYDFLTMSFSELTARFGGVVGTTFSTFPSFPQRYIEVVDAQPTEVDAHVRIERVKPSGMPTVYTADNLHIRQFLADSSRRLLRKGQHRAA